MKTTILSLTALELFFIITTIISLIANILQFMDRRNRYKPIYNELIALFNDVKNKANHLNWMFRVVFQSDNPHKEIATLRWEYGHVTQMVINALAGFQETLVGVLVTLNPRDPAGNQAFRASTFGLTQEEKEWRSESATQSMIEEAKAAILRDLANAAAPAAQNPQSAEDGGGQPPDQQADQDGVRADKPQSTERNEPGQP